MNYFNAPDHTWVDDTPAPEHCGTHAPAIDGDNEPDPVCHLDDQHPGPHENLYGAWTNPDGGYECGAPRPGHAQWCELAPGHDGSHANAGGILWGTVSATDTETCRDVNTVSGLACEHPVGHDGRHTASNPYNTAITYSWDQETPANPGAAEDEPPFVGFAEEMRRAHPEVMEMEAASARRAQLLAQLHPAAHAEPNDNTPDTDDRHPCAAPSPHDPEGRRLYCILAPDHPGDHTSHTNIVDPDTGRAYCWPQDTPTTCGAPTPGPGAVYRCNLDPDHQGAHTTGHGRPWRNYNDPTCHDRHTAPDRDTYVCDLAADHGGYHADRAARWDRDGQLLADNPTPRLCPASYTGMTGIRFRCTLDGGHAPVNGIGDPAADADGHRYEAADVGADNPDPCGTPNPANPDHACARDIGHQGDHWQAPTPATPWTDTWPQAPCGDSWPDASGPGTPSCILTPGHEGNHRGNGNEWPDDHAWIAGGTGSIMRSRPRTTTPTPTPACGDTITSLLGRQITCTRQPNHPGLHANGNDDWFIGDTPRRAAAHSCANVHTAFNGARFICNLPHGHDNPHTDSEVEWDTPAPHSTPGLPTTCTLPADHDGPHTANDTAWTDTDGYPGPEGTEWTDRDGDTWHTTATGRLYTGDVEYPPAEAWHHYGPMTRPDQTPPDTTGTPACPCGSTLTPRTRHHDACTAQAAERDTTWAASDRRSGHLWAIEMAVKAHRNTRYPSDPQMRAAILKTARTFTDALDNHTEGQP